MNRARLVVVGVLLLLFASACRVDTTVDIKVEEDGSGLVTVSIDANDEAVALLVDDPADLRFDDLEAAGWTLDGPEIDDGGITLSASKPFLSPEDLPDVLDEILGEGLIFSNVALDQQHDFAMFGLRPAETSYDFTADVDPSPNLEVLGDDVLADLLDGFPLGRPLDRIEVDAGVPIQNTLGLVVNVTLPANVGTDTGEAVDDVATWSFAYGDPAQTIDARASVDEILPRVWAVLAILAGLLFILVVLSRLGTFALGKLRTPKGRRRRDQRQREKRAATRAAEANRPRRRLLRLLIIDVHGVVVRPTEPVDGLLIPLITAERPDADPEQIRDRHRQLVLGRLSPEEFWSEVGLGPMAEEIETRYLSSFRLVPGLHPFLDRMATSRLPSPPSAISPASGVTVCAGWRRSTGRSRRGWSAAMSVRRCPSRRCSRRPAARCRSITTTASTCRTSPSISTSPRSSGWRRACSSPVLRSRRRPITRSCAASKTSSGAEAAERRRVTPLA